MLLLTVAVKFLLLFISCKRRLQPCMFMSGTGADCVGGCFWVRALVGTIMWVLNTHRNFPQFCNFPHRNAWILCADAVFISWTALKLFLPEALLSIQYAPNVIWWPGSAQTRWKAQALSRRGREGVVDTKDGKEKEDRGKSEGRGGREGRKGEEELCTHRSFQKSAPQV